MTTADIEPTQLATIRGGTFERVVVQTRERGWQLGRRYDALYMAYNCIGRFTITDNDEVYHSMLGAVPTYNAVELGAAQKAAQEQADDLYGLLSLLGRNVELEGQFTVQRWSQYRLRHAPMAHEPDMDRSFPTKAAADEHARTADSGDGGDMRYRYVVVPRDSA